MKNILLIVSFIFISISFNACGGGSDEASFKIPNVEIISCNTQGLNIPDDLTTMISGDEIIKEENNTVITTYHGINGTKKICVQSGKAYIKR